MEIVTTAFYLSTGIVAIMTYISAKKTVLQPIKTEVFKKQVEAFSKIMELFNGKDEIELRKYFGIDKMIHANAIHLLDIYAELFFDIEFDHEKRPYNRKDCPRSIFSEKFAEKYLDLANDPTIGDKNEKDVAEHMVDPKVKAAIWNTFEYGEISIPKEYTMALDRIESIMKSPFLTTKSIKYLKAIKDSVLDNTALIGKVLTRISKQLPEKYPNFSQMKTASIAWIENEYNSEFVSLSDYCDKLTDYLRDYFKSDFIMN